MKKLKYGTLLGLIGLMFLTSLSAKDRLTKEGEAYLEETRKITGDITESAANGKLTEDRRGGYFDNYMDTVIWNDTFTKKTNKIPQVQISVAGQQAIPLDSPVEKLKVEWDEEEARLEKLRAANKKKNKRIPAIFAGGYCTFDETLSISKSNVYGKLDCLLDFGDGQYRRAEVFTGFYPDYKREMVIAIPVYMTFENQSRATFSGIVLKSNKSSMNMAGWIDNRRMQKMLGEGLLATNEIVYKYASGYMNALQQSKIREEVVYPDGNLSRGALLSGYYPSTTKIRNVAPPEAKDYIITAGIELLSNIFAIGGKDYLYSKQPLFAVYPQKVYVEGMVSFDNQGLARRFGQISQNTENRANTNNQQWLGERNQIIQKYNGSNLRQSNGIIK
jgi:hypothetical protein